LSADVDVELDVVDRNNKPPVWDANVYGPIHIKENVTVGTVVTSVKARFVCHDMTETRHVTCRAVPCSALRPLHLSDRSNDLFLISFSLSFSLSLSPRLFVFHSFMQSLVRLRLPVSKRLLRPESNSGTPGSPRLPRPILVATPDLCFSWFLHVSVHLRALFLDTQTQKTHFISFWMREHLWLSAAR